VLEEIGGEDEDVEAFLEALPLKLDVYELVGDEVHCLLKALHVEGESGQLAHLPHRHHLVPVAHHVFRQPLRLALLPQHLL
jgi:hypothetical protein